MGISLYVGLGVAGLLVLLALLVLFWPKGADPKTAVTQIVGLPENLGRVDALEHARRKVAAEEALKREARAEVEAEVMRGLARVDAVNQAQQAARISAALSGGLVTPIPPAPAPAPAGN